MEKIKLVVWDLDETFWKGTLSEGEVELVPENIEIVKELTRRGIINSISSKNDYESAKSVLEKAEVWDYFVFPSIDWAAKGQNVRNVIEQCQLRAPNILFIDDNVGNRKEVEHYNPGINTADESIIPQLLQMDELKGKDDSSLSRLKQYKILEQKAEAKATYNDNTAFLRDSDIRISFINDCSKHRDRILELINRTNQLNYTKKRLTEIELDELLNNPLIEQTCIHVNDKFGDYGICGFYAYNRTEGKLLHFLFSCRILNLGIPSYIYQKLGKPKLQIEIPVAEELSIDGIDWITEEEFTMVVDTRVQPTKKKTRMLMLGGCDLEQMCHYIDKNKFEVLKEFNYPSPHGFPVHREHTVYLREMEQLTQDEIEEIGRLPFGDSKMFKSKLFSNDYDILVYSVLMNYTHEVYRHKDKGYKIAYGGYLKQNELCAYLQMNQEESEAFKRTYEYEGQQTPHDFIADLIWLNKKIRKPIVFINGAETPDVNEKEQDAAQRHQDMNAALEEFVSQTNNCSIVDVRKFINGKKEHKDTIRHYQRSVYVKMAEELMTQLSGNHIEVKSVLVLKERLKSILIRIKRKFL